ncbi:uncharacterized protein DUF397 [Micromonospora pisi]|uniref:Uncharacterized protein DUF397 n=1 Tax=Micromonospora pisi TaxID=589240 RepID=A0A495JJ51_9ACTN|nr:DUF397 domain-containing protein [Micromonospora pisi]RKR88947.1 uncharacterized protein DUF397 [Micromonospora pisi]
MSDLAASRWRKSSRSNSQGQCVEVADNLVGVVGVRDSKDVAGPVLTVGRAGWAAFVVGVKSGRLLR